MTEMTDEMLREVNEALVRHNEQLLEENDALHEANRQEQTYIANLRETVERLRAALQDIAQVLGPYSPLEMPSMATVLQRVSDTARNALAGQPTEKS